LCPWCAHHSRGRRWHRANTGDVHPPQIAPGLGPPRTRTARGYNNPAQLLDWM